MVSIQVGPVTTLDGGKIPRPLQIVHGRADIGTQPDPPSMEFEWWDEAPPGVLGDLVQVWDEVPYTPAVYDDPVVTYDSPSSVYDSTATGTVTAPHYVGRIVGVEATGHTGHVQTWRVTTVGLLAQWGTIPVKLVGLPAQSDVARVQAIVDEAGWGTALIVDGAPGVTLAAGDVDSDLLSAVHDVCRSSGGMLWQDRDGALHYTTAGYRAANQAPDFAIDASVIEDVTVWEQQTTDIVNRVVVAFGPASARGETIVEDPDSIVRPWGLRSIDVDTMCAAEADAEAIGALIVGRRAWPYWGSISPLATLDPPTEVLFATADVNTVVMLPIPRDPGPTPLVDPTPWVVEGWVETWTEGMEHTAALAVSDQRRWVTTTLRTYAEVLAMGTYADILGEGFFPPTYLDLLVKEA